MHVFYISNMYRKHRRFFNRFNSGRLPVLLRDFLHNSDELTCKELQELALKMETAIKHRNYYLGMWEKVESPIEATHIIKAK